MVTFNVARAHKQLAIYCELKSITFALASPQILSTNRRSKFGPVGTCWNVLRFPRSAGIFWILLNQTECGVMKIQIRINHLASEVIILIGRFLGKNNCRDHHATPENL